ncbi:MAG: hypothetical protein AAGD06_03515 [Acidobacteriota bacterium]
MPTMHLTLSRRTQSRRRTAVLLAVAALLAFAPFASADDAAPSPYPAHVLVAADADIWSVPEWRLAGGVQLASASEADGLGHSAQRLQAGLGVFVGCFASGTGDWLCSAAVSGGSGSYAYWWTYSGNGNLYQTGGNTATISNCLSGVGTLQVNVRDRNTNATGFRSHTIHCGNVLF